MASSFFVCRAAACRVACSSRASAPTALPPALRPTPTPSRLFSTRARHPPPSLRVQVLRELDPRPFSSCPPALFPRSPPQAAAAGKPPRPADPLSFQDALERHSLPIPKEPKPLSFKHSLGREEPQSSFSEDDDVRQPSIRNQVLFFTGGSILAFGLAAQHTNFDTAYWTKQLKAVGTFGMFSEPSSEEIRRAKYITLRNKLQNSLNSFREAVKDTPFANTAVWAYYTAIKWYFELPDPKRICYQLAAFNFVVFCAWQLPILRAYMRRSWLHDPLSGRSYTMLTSSYSHESFMHLFFNCFVLPGFGSLTVVWMAQQQSADPTGRRESTPHWHFLAFFAAAGMFSSLASHIAAIRVRFPRLLAQFAHESKSSASRTSSSIASFLRSGSTAASGTTTTATGTTVPKIAPILPSLGSSGAIYATLVVVALAFPETEVALIFLPFLSLNIAWGMGGMVLFDVLGILRGWQTFDHVAHLGGAVFGFIYFTYGPEFWNFMRSICPPIF